MKAFLAMAAVSVGLMGAMSAVSAQPYDGYRGRDDGYRERGDGYRGDGYRSRDEGYGGRGYREAEGGFDEGEYLRCNPDVRRAVAAGTMESGAAHYRVFGRREGRRLSC